MPLLIVASALAACGAENRPSQDVVARVNGEEITVHQLNERLAGLELPADADLSAARKRLLDSMIDEQLLVQKALARGLDRQLATRKSIEHSRRQLLAKAAIEDMIRDPEVSEKDARAFYQANPDLFGNRRLYTFRRFFLQSTKIEGPVRAKLDSARTGAQVAAALKGAGIAYSHLTELRTAESLPAEVLSRAARMAPGDILLLSEDSGIALMQLAGSVAEPVSLAAALPSIQTYLADAKRQQRAARLVKDLRSKAKLEYVVQTADAGKPTALADGKPVLGEPPLKKPLQSQQITVVR